MRRAVIGLCALLLLSVAASNLYAQSEQNYEDQQDNKEYNDEDSQPLKFASYFVAPIGFVVEWTVMRPMHYLATNTFLAPVFNEKPEPEGPSIPTAELPPPDVISDAPQPAPPANVAPAAPQAPAPAPPPRSDAGQPALH
jgi:hypothetical protein